AGMIRVVEGRCAAIKGGIIEVPLRRSDLPNELRKIAPVLLVARPAAFDGKIILVPPLEFSLWRQRHLVGFLAAEIKTADDCFLDLESIQESDDIDRKRRLLAITESCGRQKFRRAIAAQIRDAHSVHAPP